LPETGLQGWKSIIFSGCLTLAVACLKSNARIWPGWINRATIISEESAWTGSGDHEAPTILAELIDDFLDGPVGSRAVRGGEPHFPESIQFVGFDDEVSSAAGSALIAVITVGHVDSLSELLSACIPCLLISAVIRR
jgi:hypothetical protein